jgi:SAM-dependent methyltransferase
MPDLAIDTPGRLRQVRYSLECLGWRRTAHELVNGRRPYDPAADETFDQRHGTDTAGSIEPEHLGIADEQRRGDAILYLPSPTSVTSWMLDELAADPSSTSFVDLGCGKGRVLLVAAERPFQRVLGVEISAQLAGIARQNAERYRPPPALRSPIDVLEADVTTVDLPETDLLIHLYHPFDPAVSAAVLRRLEASLAATPRRVTIAYLLYSGAVGPVAEMFSGFPWLHRTRYEQSIRGTYDWLFYTS